MKLLQRVIGPVATNLYVLGDEGSGEAIAIDTATPCVEWVTATLAERGWTLKLIVSTHRHWDHIGDNTAVQSATGADIAADIADRHGLENPAPSNAPFPIPPSVPALDLAEGSRIKFGAIDLEVLHTPGHTEGSVCLLAADERLLLTGDTLFAGAWGRTDLPGGTRSDGRFAQPIERHGGRPRVMPGHGSHSTMRGRKAVARTGGTEPDPAPLGVRERRDGDIDRGLVHLRPDRRRR